MGLISASVVVDNAKSKKTGATRQQSAVAQMYQTDVDLGIGDNLTEGSSIVKYYTFYLLLFLLIVKYK